MTDSDPPVMQDLEFKSAVDIDMIVEDQNSWYGLEES